MNRPLLITLAGAAAIALAISLSLWSNSHDGGTVAETPTAPPPAAKSANADAAKEALPAPSFDIVRINAQGETVIAGRGAPKAEIIILDGGKELGRVTADARGEWVFLPENPLAPGSRDLSLKAINPDGKTIDGAAPVVLMVPERGKDKSGALAVKINADGSIEILQDAVIKDGAGTVSVSAVKYDDKGRLSVAGKAPAKAKLRVYLDNAPLGQASADEQGRWSINKRAELRAGSHSIRVDELDDKGKVAARAEISFTPTGTLPPEGKITVEPGNSLWRIARKTYGTGFDYMTLYQANKDQIRDPNRIYPGQVFNVPGK